MTSKHLMTLAVITAIAVIAAIFSVQQSQAGLSQAERGNAFVPGLINKANNIDNLAVIDGDTTMMVRRDGERFLDASGYPVRSDAVRDLVTTVSLLTIEERKTDQPDRFKDLELASPDAEEGGGRQLVLKNGELTIADLIVGTRDFSVGGTRGGVFARRSDQPPAYLLRGEVIMPGTRSGWFDTSLYQRPKEKILSAQVKPDKGQAIRLARSASSGSLLLDNLPSGRSADPSKVQRIADIASTLSFEDVRKASGQPSGVQLSAIADNKLRYVVQPVGEFDPENTWIQIQVQPESVKDAAEANKVNEVFKGFEFKLSRFNAEPLNWKLTDVLVDPNAPKSPAGMNQGRPGMPPGMPNIPGMPQMPGMPAPK